MVLFCWGRLRLRVPAFRPTGTLFWGGLLVVSVITVIAPGRQFAHYLLFLIWPIAGLIVCLIGNYANETNSFLKPNCALYIAWLTPFFMLMPFGGSVNIDNRYLAAERAIEDIKHACVFDKNDTLFVWGYAPSYYVELALTPATREVATPSEIMGKPMPEYSRACIQADLLAAPPSYIIDSVGPSDNFFHDIEKQSVSLWPWLESFIAERYTLVPLNSACRLYKRKDICK